MEIKKLRIPSGWNIEINTLYDIETQGDIEEDLMYELYNTIFYVERVYENIKLGVNMEWLPNSNPEGMFSLQVIINDNWECPNETYKNKDLNSIVNEIEEILLRYSISIDMKDFKISLWLRWFPSIVSNGEYILKVILNNNLLKPIEEFKIKKEDKLLQKMFEITQNYAKDNINLNKENGKNYIIHEINSYKYIRSETIEEAKNLSYNDPQYLPNLNNTNLEYTTILNGDCIKCSEEKSIYIYNAQNIIGYDNGQETSYIIVHLVSGVYYGYPISKKNLDVYYILLEE